MIYAVLIFVLANALAVLAFGIGVCVGAGVQTWPEFWAVFQRDQY